MSKNIKSIPFSYINHLQEVHYKKNDIDRQDVDMLLNRFRQVNQLPFNLIPAFFLLDYVKRDYVLVSEGAKYIYQYKAEDFMYGGLDMLLSIFNKDDFKVYNEQLFGANWKFLKSVPQETHRDYIFNFSFRVKNGKGQLIQTYQRGNYITSPDGHPLYSLGMMMNVTGLMNPRVMYHSIEKVERGRFGEEQIIEQNWFYPYEEDTILTERERDIAGYIADGWSIKQIADKLNLTGNTVANHRKNMMRKTNTRNMAELTAFVLRNHII